MHGGDIYTRRVRADFSINVNPMGLAEPVRQALIRSADLCVHYPDPACRELRGMLAERASVETKQVVAGNGASELITAIVQAVQPRRALLLSPCFSGYERALEAAMAQCFYLSTDADHRFLPGEEWISELRQVRPDLVFLTNPGNPAGSMFSRAQVLAAADSLRLRGGILVVDECFLPLSDRPEESVLADVQSFRSRSNLIVLNAFTKTYCIPGVRLGYCVCADSILAAKIAAQLPEWSVSVPAQEAGKACMQLPAEYISDSVALIRRERARLTVGLRGLDGAVSRIIPSETCFLLFQSRRKDWKKRLLERGILIRSCVDYDELDESWFRIAVRTPEENDLLLSAMREILGQRKAE